MSELCYLSIAEAARLIRTRKLSPLELTRAHLDRIGQLDATLRSYITVTREHALAEAEQATREIARGRYLGELHGIPISLKDIIDTGGTRTTAASALYADRIPDRDAHVVTRLRAAGAILLGKANLFEFAWAPTTEESLFKPSRNPWNIAYPPGGSSSGSAAGVAAGLAMASIGSDSGGSIRNPATYCGLTGLKPTYGLVSRTGVFPLSYSTDTVGPMTRSAEDASILLDAMAGFDPEDRTMQSRPPSLTRRALNRPVRGRRLGICTPLVEAAGGDRDVLSAFDEALRTFRSLGAEIREVRLPHAAYAAAAVWTLLRIEGFRVHERRLREHHDRLGAAFFRNTAVGGFLSAQSYLRAQQARTLISDELAQAFEEVELLLLPTNPRSASPPSFASEPADPKIARSAVAYVTPFNLNGSPAISIPAGFNSQGMPMGLQIAGRPHADADVLALAHQYQSQTDWHRRRPPLNSTAGHWTAPGPIRA